MAGNESAAKHGARGSFPPPHEQYERLQHHFKTRLVTSVRPNASAACEALKRLPEADKPILVVKELLDMGVDFTRPITTCVPGSAELDYGRTASVKLSIARRGGKLFPDLDDFHVSNLDPVVAWPLASLNNTDARQYARLIVELGFDVNQPLPGGRTLLMVAAANRNMAACKVLVKAGARADRTCHRGLDAMAHYLDDLHKRGAGISAYGTGPMRFARQLTDAWKTLVRDPRARKPGDALWRRVMAANLCRLPSAQLELMAGLRGYKDELADELPREPLANVLHGLLDNWIPVPPRVFMANWKEKGVSPSIIASVTRENRDRLSDEAVVRLWSAAIQAGASAATPDAEGWSVLEKLERLELRDTEVFAMSEAAMLRERAPARSRESRHEAAPGL